MHTISTPIWPAFDTLRISRTLCFALSVALLLSPLNDALSYLHSRYRARASVPERLEQYGESARARWEPYFKRAGVSYPPNKVVLVGLKQERQLEVYAANGQNTPRFIRALPILAASGTLGPKLRQGDMQVPEGLYRIESLNPNSAFHLSLRVNYPNAEDRAQARLDRRTNLGGDIMIHGNRVSIGCLAMGDEAAEDLFTLAADTKLAGVTVILSPVDFREHSLPATYTPPDWVSLRYQQIRTSLASLQR